MSPAARMAQPVGTDFRMRGKRGRNEEGAGAHAAMIVSDDGDNEVAINKSKGKARESRE